MPTICTKCGIGFLIQLACDDDDVCYCPICEEITPSCIARDNDKLVDTKDNRN